MFRFLRSAVSDRRSQQELAESAWAVEDRLAREAAAPTEPQPEALYRALCRDAAIGRMDQPVSTEVILADYLAAVGVTR